MDHIFNNLPTPNQIYFQKKKEYIQIMKRFNSIAKVFITFKEKELKNLSKLLEVVSPKNILKRGYTYVKDLKNDTYIKSINKIKDKTNIKIRFHDGIIQAITKKK